MYYGFQKVILRQNMKLKILILFVKTVKILIKPLHDNGRLTILKF